MKRAQFIVLVVMVLGLVLFTVAFLQPRVVAKASAPDGTQLYVVQRVGDDSPFLNTSTYVRLANGSWLWFYLDHEDGPWLRGSIQEEPSTKRLTIVRNGARIASYDWQKQIYYIGNDNGRDGSVMPAGWDLFKDLRPWTPLSLARN